MNNLKSKQQQPSIFKALPATIVNQPSFLDNASPNILLVSNGGSNSKMRLHLSEPDIPSLNYENVEGKEEEHNNDSNEEEEGGGGYYEDIFFRGVGDKSSRAVFSDYEEVVVQGSSSAPNDKQQQAVIEGQFGMARRFPSIKLSKKEKKMRQQQLLQEQQQSVKSCSLDDLYSKPEKETAASLHKKKSNTILPVVQSSSVATLVSSGDHKSSTLGSIISQRLSLKRDFGQRVKRDKCVNRMGWCWCCCSWRRRRGRSMRVTQPEQTELGVPREEGKRCFTTSFLCAVIAVSIIVVIVAGAVLLYHFLSGEVVKVPQAEVNDDITRKKQQTINTAAAAAASPQQLESKDHLPSTLQPKTQTETTRSSAAPTPSPAPHAGWASWSAWSKCSEKCQKGESQARTRACLDKQGSTLNDLKTCIQEGGLNVEIRLCLCNQSSAWREKIVN